MSFKQVRNKKHFPVSEQEIRDNMRGICHHPFADCVQLINNRLGVKLVEPYWQPIWDQLRIEEKRRFPHANFRT